ncbi:MAG: right-handed parallel beta-helix repeat-containing protein [Candidatus Bipolaricaulota bacterium]
MRWRSCLWFVALGIAIAAGAMAGAATVNVPTDYTTIQAAVNGAAAGDTIVVAAGTYAESVTVNKTLTIRGEAGSVLQGAGSGNGFLIQGKDIAIEGFQIKGYLIGVRTYGGPSSYDTLALRDLAITGNAIGMQINRDGFSTLTIDGCQIKANTQEGMSVVDHLLGSQHVGTLLIQNSDVSSNGRHGFMLVRTKIDQLTIIDSKFDGATTAGFCGISFVSSPSQIGAFTMSGGSLSGNKGGGLYIVQVAHTLGSISLDGVAVQGNAESGITLGGGATTGSLAIRNSLFSGNAWEEFDLSGGWFGKFSVSGATTIQGNSFLRSGGTWVAIYVGNQAVFGSVPEINGNDIVGYGVENYASGLIDCSGNWWGSATGRVLAASAAYSPWLANSTSAATWTFVVDDVGTSPPQGYLQAALDQVRAGDAVLVKAGQYVTQAVVGVGVQIIGEPGAVVKAPGSTTYTIAESGNTFDPIVFAYGGTIAGVHVSGPEISQTDIAGLEIDGQNKAQASPRFVGILLRNVEGTIAGNTIHDLYDADGQGNGPQTFGILVYGDSDVSLLGNTISEFSRGGIGVLGDVVGWARGPLADPNALIQGNTVVGNGYEAGSGWWAENGIQIGYGATGEILDNTVMDCRVNNPSWSSTGILIVGSDDVLVSGNTVGGNDNGIAVMGLTAWGGGPATGNVLSHNDVVANEWGIGLQYDAVDTEISGNVITGNVGEGIYAYGDGGSAEPYGTIVRYNVVAGNGYGLVNWGVLGSLDAILNWWGSADGPWYDEDFDALPEYAGSGDSIYGAVIFSPWLGMNPDGDGGQVGVQLISPMLIIVDDVGPAPAEGYLGAAVGGANALAGHDTIEVRDGAYTATTAIADGVTIASAGGTGKTTIGGALSIDAGDVLIGGLGHGFSMYGPVTVGPGVDAATVHINWNDLYDVVTNNGLGWLDATFNYWGEDGPDTVGMVDTYPFLPETAETILGYMDEHGLTALEAMDFASFQNLYGNVRWSLAALALMQTFGMSYDEAAALVDEYGATAIWSALRGAMSYEDFVIALLGYGAEIPAGGAGGGAEEGVPSTYLVGDLVPFTLMLTHPVTGEVVEDALVTYTVALELADGTYQFVAFGVVPYDEAVGGYAALWDTTGAAPGTYDVFLGSDDGRSVHYTVEIVAE